MTNQNSETKMIDCPDYSFNLQISGQVKLGTNKAGAPSRLVLSAVHADDEPPAATVAPNLVGDEVFQAGVTFSQGEPQTFAGVGTLTLTDIHGENGATFCFEPAESFTPDDGLDSSSK